MRAWRLRRLAGWLFPALFALAGCALNDAPPTSGDCVAVIGGQPRPLSAVSRTSYFYRDDRHGGAEYAYVQLEFRPEPVETSGALLKLKGHLDGMPDEEYLGVHPLPTGESAPGYVDEWDIEAPAGASVVSGTLALIGATRMAITGTLRMELSDQTSYACALVIGRNIAKDTDD